MILVIIVAILGLIGIGAAGILFAMVAANSSKSHCGKSREQAIYGAVAYLVTFVILIMLLIFSAFI